MRTFLLDDYLVQDFVRTSQHQNKKYDPLLSGKFKELVASTNSATSYSKMLQNGKELSSKFPALLENAQSELDNFKTADDYISVTYPTEGQQNTAGQTVTVSGTVKDDCTLTLNGQAVGVGATDKKFAPVATVVEGLNRLGFVVTNKRGKTYNKDITIVGILPAPVQPSVTPSTATPYVSPSQPLTKDSPDYKCACIQKGYEVELTDPLVYSFQTVFNSLQSKYPSETRMSIADYICKAKELIETETIVKKTLLEVAQEINNGITPEIAQSISLKEEAALYVTLVKQNGQ